MELQFLSICCFHIHLHLIPRIQVNEMYEEMEEIDLYMAISNHKTMENITRIHFNGEFNDAIHFIVL